MRHGKKGKKFGLKRGPRRLFLKVMANNFILHDKIVTTEARAKELRGKVERFITYGKKQNLAALRLLLQKLPKGAAYKIYHDIAPRYTDRRGGYTRIIKLAKLRKHDGTKMARLEFV
ncbi:MAG: 50S ribosomal protein L17 [Patescibacteria group bacterium]